MKVIDGPRCCGKTTRAVRYCEENDCILVVHAAEAKREIDSDITVMTYYDIVKDKHLGMNKPLFIDNMDMFVHWAVNHEVAGFTVNTGTC